MLNNRKPSPGTGALVGLGLTAPLLTVLFLAAPWIGTPFVPFDLFDWVARTLPGPVITLGIDLMTSVIAALNLQDTSQSAKTAEHILAVALLLVIGMAVGAGLFALYNRRSGISRALAGLLMGLALGLILLLMVADVNQTATASPLVSIIWILLAFGAWGYAFNWVYTDLSRLPAEQPLPSANAPFAAVETLDRRGFLVRLGGAAAAITVIGAGIGALNTRLTVDENNPAAPLEPAWSDANPLPNAADPLQPAPGTRPEFTLVRDHYRIDINTLPPVLREESWMLPITGLVDTPLELTLQDLRTRYEPVHQFVTLSCISNAVGGDLIGTQRWTGVPLSRILADAGLQPSALYLNITAADGFHEAVWIGAIQSDERIMLCYAWDDLPLPIEHGFPVRIYIPDLYGMKQPKWITGIEVTERFDEGYWVRRGWDEVAQVQLTSVVDTVAVENLIPDGDTTLVPVGGIAYAGDRGISRVEMRVDDGDWQPAELRAPLSGTTWVIWRYDWPFQAGEHRFTVRCVDSRDIRQIEQSADSLPSGATGLHGRPARL